MALGTVPTNDLSCYRGEDFTPTWVVGADLSTDITGWTLVMTIKDADTNPTFTKTINGAVTDGPNRLFKVAVPAATNGSISPVVAKYDVWRTDTGFEWVLSIGNYTVLTERRV